MSVRPWRLSIPLQIPYEAYVAEYYNFFFQNLLEEGKYLCTWMEDENINIAEDIPVYLAFDFIDHVLKRKAPIRLSSRDYYTFMAESRGFVKKIPSLRIAHK